AATPTQTTGTSVEGVAVSLTYYAGTTATGTALPGAPVAVGTYTVVANFPGSLNYAPTKTSATYAITRAVPTFSFQLPDGAPYSGLAHPAQAFVAGADKNPVATLDNVAPTLTYYAGTSVATGTRLSSAPVAAGTYIVVATFPGSANFAAASATSAPFQIARA